MTDKLYLIGEFASLNKVTARMLRHYDQIGLLHPVLVKENGYRYYSEQQIGIISTIKMLRNCDFSLEEIEQILKNDNDAFFIKQVKSKINDLNHQAKLHQQTITLLESFCRESRQNGFVNQYGISLTQREETTLLASSQTFDLEQIEKEFEKLYIFIEKHHLTTDGCAVLLGHSDKTGEDNNQVGVPISTAYQNTQYSTIVLPGSQCISTIHYGDYYHIGHAYNSLLKYAEVNGYLVEPYFMERYLIDHSHTSNPHQYITEISFFKK